MDLERWRVNSEIAGLRVRFVVWTAIQIFSFVIILTGAILLFEVFLLANGVPVDILPLEAIHEFGRWSGLSPLFLVIIGIVLAALTTR